MSACAAPGSEPAPGALPRDLARQPQVLPSTQLPEETPSPTPAKKKKRTNGESDNGAPNGGSSGGTGSPTAPRAIGGLGDATGDGGLQAPAYADLTAVTIVDTGRRVRFVVDVAAKIPGKLADGEVMGLGVDVYRGAGSESDYQVFADGSSEGWFAYLQTPNGFVPFPGAFLIGGRRMVFEVPWSSLRSPDAGSFSAFLDWSKKATPINQFGSDHAPNSGKGQFQR